MRQALDLAAGKRADPSFWRALAASPEEAAELIYRDKSRRREAELIARGRP